jgi:hypothetical protein
MIVRIHQNPHYFPMMSSISKYVPYALASLITVFSYASETASDAKSHAEDKTLNRIVATKGFTLRFIRLQHGGAGWDDGMRTSRADTNLLNEFGKQTGVRVATKGESHPVSHLEKYTDDGFPPFVFLTGKDKLGPFSDSDIRILRKYCQTRGMLIVDADSPAFHKAFRALMTQVFPDKALTDIPASDPIYQVPYHLAEGIHKAWAHGGRTPQGIRINGRWRVFYHPGDMNEAWKNAGSVETSPDVCQQNLQLGINLIYHAFDNYFAVQDKLKPLP